MYAIASKIKVDEHPMNKKPNVSGIYKPKPKTKSTLPSWNNGADVEIHLYARSLQKSAKTLVEKFGTRPERQK
jgi:hypothetical protein